MTKEQMKSSEHHQKKVTNDYPQIMVKNENLRALIIPTT